MGKADDVTKLLDERAASYPRDQVRRLCVSCASFIAEIDSSSPDVAAYLEQRLGALLLIAHRQGGVMEFERALQDGRKVSPVTPKSGG